MAVNDLPIGVFDSGVGGLTVLQALIEQLPGEDFLYLGDTARLPYGTKSPATVSAYACQAASLLVERGVKALVVACNTASAFALQDLADMFGDVPVFGVVEPGAAAVLEVAGCDSGVGVRQGDVLVLATESTISGGAYQRALLRDTSQLTIYGRSCPLWVTLAEMGTRSDTLVEQILQNDLRGFLTRAHHHRQRPLTILLGCTHFPVFKQAISNLYEAAGVPVTLVDSATTTAAAVASNLGAADRLCAQARTGEVGFLATDDVSRFIKVGRQFLPGNDALAAVELVDLR